ncbi:electron transfer flavoprotein subunit beta/FixA family protein [Clostridium sp. CS001]|uniref:electron transfer flavoprotein subunit beta n=1 Tax=Clostridium sp. CS001 TaxID=2880648 RepID=UPI001CF20432|nr:electron transfer flavoprotein subunit beta [Clostridium sp. CS001]MCB2288644.1 electron transfer flavoprotein subunit beta/FixA family protein [Clostridium sp. CS001]
MKILVCVKQVPDTTEVKIDKEKGTLIRDGVPSILNPDDANALEEALKIKDNYEDVIVTVLSMGPPQADYMLRECLAMGADEAVLLSDRAFGGSDTWATSNAIVAGIKTIGNFDIIFAGRQAIDGDTAQVGPQIAEKLCVSQVTYVQSLKIDGNELEVERQLEDGHEIIKVNMPVLLTAVKELNEPRYMAVDKIFDAYKKEIKILGFNDISIDVDKVGLKASPTKVFKSFTPEPKAKGVILQGTSKDRVEQLIVALKQKHII